MANRWTTPRRVSAGVACGIAVLLAAPALASANSFGFSIINQTGSSLRLKSIDISDNQPFEVVDGVARRPLEGLTLEPNAAPFDVELARDKTHRTADLVFVSPHGIEYQVQLANYARFPRGGIAHAASAACTPNRDSTARCEVDSSEFHPTIRLFDPPGTIRTVPEADTKTQLRVLWDLCRNGGAGRCSFEPDDDEAHKPADTFAPARVVGQPILNCGDAPLSDKYSFKETAYSTSSVGVEAGVTLKLDAVFATVKAKFSASYGYTWGDSHTFAQTLTIPDVLPRHVAFLEQTVAVKRAYGTFTAHVNNTTWVLEHASFDAPDPDRTPPAAVQNRLATSSELAVCDKRATAATPRPSSTRIRSDRV
jgi:hypothetical protein